jgi:hypothetical protein
VAAVGDDRRDDVPLPPVLGEAVLHQHRLALSADHGEMGPQARCVEDEVLETGHWR